MTYRPASGPTHSGVRMLPQLSIAMRKLLAPDTALNVDLALYLHEKAGSKV